jgi:hypothetical protein
MGTARLSSAVRLSASTLVATSTSKACWLNPLTLSRPRRCLSRLNAASR